MESKGVKWKEQFCSDSKINAKEVLEILAKSNAFRKSAIKKEIMVVDLAKTLNKLGEDLRNQIE